MVQAWNRVCYVFKNYLIYHMGSTFIRLEKSQQNLAGDTLQNCMTWSQVGSRVGVWYTLG